jgi:hypothetical protein
MKIDCEKALFRMAWDFLICKTELETAYSLGARRIVYPNIDLKCLPEAARNLCKKYTEEQEGE